MLNQNIENAKILQNKSDNQEIWENIFRKNRSDIYILELGIGIGANLWFCTREGFNVSGCEFSQAGVDRFNANQFNAILDIFSLAYNDFEKTKIIIEKSIYKLKVDGKLLSITPTFNNFGFYEDKNYPIIPACKPTQGACAFTGLIDIQDIHSLYNGVNYKVANIALIATKQIESQMQNELFIVEVTKI